MPKNNQRGSNNNNPEGRNQFNNGWMDSARERPMAAAAVAAATVGAGVFLWSRRSQITEQLSNISDQIGEWSQNMSSSGSSEFETAGASSDFTSSAGTGSSGSFAGGTSGSAGTGSSGSFAGGTSGSAGMSETGGGNASLGAQTGGGGIGGASGKSGRGRA